MTMPDCVAKAVVVAAPLDDEIIVTNEEASVDELEGTGVLISDVDARDDVEEDAEDDIEEDAEGDVEEDAEGDVEEDAEDDTENDA